MKKRPQKGVRTAWITRNIRHGRETIAVWVSAPDRIEDGWAGSMDARLAADDRDPIYALLRKVTERTDRAYKVRLSLLVLEESR